MALLKSKSAPAPEPAPGSPIESRIRDLENEVKYHGLPAEARITLEANDERERREQSALIERESRMKAATAEKEAKFNQIKRDLLKTRHLQIAIDGKRADTLNENGTVACPSCGRSMRDVGIAIDSLVERWRTGGGNPSGVCIRDARGPLSSVVGMPFMDMSFHCPECGNEHRVWLMLSVMG